MTFFKWFLYLVALSAFIWFVFFRPMGENTALATEPSTKTTPTGDNPAENSRKQEIDYSIENENVTENQDDAASESEDYVSETTNRGINLNNKYLIVVGSFGVKANAEKMLKRVENDGKEGVITSIRGLHRVITASTDDEGDAKNLRSHFTHIYKEQAFILTQ